MTYSATIKTARMTVVRDGANSGKLQLMGPDGSTVLHEVTLDASSGTVSGAVLTLAGFPKAAAALVASTWASLVLSARIRNSSNADVKTGLTVGLKSTSAPAWTGSTTYAVDDTRTNGANQYRVVSQTGASAASGGPTGTGASIADGGVVWAYIAPANAHVQLTSLRWSIGDTITIEAGPTLTHAA